MKSATDVKKAKKTSSNLTSLISYYDGLRSAIVSDPKQVLKKTKAAGVDKAYWKYFSKETEKVVRKMRRSSRITIMVRVNKILQFVSIAYFMIVIVIALFWQRKVELPTSFVWLNLLISWPSIIFLFILIDISLLLLSLTKYQIKKFSEEGIKETEIAKQRLKETVQHHIEKLKENIEKYGLKPKDYEMKLHKADYKGIKITKKPWILRGYYLAIVDTESKKD